MKRERDRLSARVQALTGEMTELGDTHTANERKLRDDCDAKVSQETGRVEALNGDLASCQVDLRDVRSSLGQCREEVRAGGRGYLRGLLHCHCVIFAVESVVSVPMHG